jgi:outer membrane receptor for ferrienterochelin and colicins
MQTLIPTSKSAVGRPALIVRTLRTGVCFLIGMMTGANVSAQSLDYRAMEQLFGEPVTASATGKPQRQSDAPVNMEIITQDDIRRSGATSIPDVLQFVQGVDVRRTGMAGVDVGIRG